MHKLIPAFLLIIACSVISLAQTIVPSYQTDQATPQDWQTLTGEAYSISHPANWEANSSGLMGTQFMIFSPLSNSLDQFRDNVNLVIQDLSGFEVNLDLFVEASEGQIANLINNGKLLSSDRQQLGEQPCHRFVYTGTQGIYQLKFEQYCWVIDHEAFILTFTSEEKEYDQFQPIVAEIFKSFQLK